MPLSIAVSGFDAQRREAIVGALSRLGLAVAGEGQAVSVGIRGTATQIVLTAADVVVHFSSAVAADDLASAARLAVTVASVEASVRKLEDEEAVGLVASIAAHDARNVLVSLEFAATSLLAREDPIVQQFAHILLEGCQRIASILRRVARLHDGICGRVDVNAVVHELTSTLTALVGNRARLFTRLESPLPTVWMDANALERSLINLVANAADAGQGGRIVLATSARRGEDGSRWVVVEVEDDGVGMDETTRSRALEPFFTTKAAAGGSGLGLASVARAARDARGRVEIDSAPGRGTRVAIWLPGW